jgi:hypothetical protein
MARRLVYRSLPDLTAATAVSESVLLVVPWESGSGRIPPPEIVFRVAGMPPLVFIYQGES